MCPERIELQYAAATTNPPNAVSNTHISYITIILPDVCVGIVYYLFSSLAATLQGYHQSQHTGTPDGIIISPNLSYILR